MILFDSDVAIEVLRKRPEAVEWFNSLPGREELAMPGFVAMELTGGCKSKRELRDFQGWIERFQILWLPTNRSQQALADYFEITLRNAIGVLDVLIAHTALHHGVALHTFNKKHYSAVKGWRTIQPFSR